MIFQLAVEVRFKSDADATDDEFEAYLDCILAELHKIGSEEADLAASLSERTAEFVMPVEADGPESAIIDSLTSLRTALHSAECATRTWPAAGHVTSARTLEVDDPIPA